MFAPHNPPLLTWRYNARSFALWTGKSRPPPVPDIYGHNYLPETDHVIKVPQVRNLMRPSDHGEASLKTGAGITKPRRGTCVPVTLYGCYL